MQKLLPIPEPNRSGERIAAETLASQAQRAYVSEEPDESLSINMQVLTVKALCNLGREVRLLARHKETP